MCSFSNYKGLSYGSTMLRPHGVTAANLILNIKTSKKVFAAGVRSAISVLQNYRERRLRCLAYFNFID